MPGEPDARSAMSVLDRTIRACRRCPLSQHRTHAVPGEGPVPCRVLFIGEAPGRREDQTGRPFMGRAGNILSGLLVSAGLSREVVFITSVVKCRPPSNRVPGKLEIAACRPYLEEQIALLGPECIAPMGRVATASIFSLYDLPFPSLQEVRQREFMVRETMAGNEVIIHPVYHPAVATHDPRKRGELQGDFRALGECLRRRS